jgi:hypothetical protein
MTAIPGCVSLTLAAAFLAVPGSAQIWGRPTPCGPAIGLLIENGLILTAEGLIYDSNQRLCWLADANLAGNPFARPVIAPLLAPVNPDPDGDGPTLPVINPDGTMDFETALNWVNALNAFNKGKGWLNHKNWQLPTTIAADTTCSSFNNGNFGALCSASALANLYAAGLTRKYPNSVVSDFFTVVSPFINLQPDLYWSSSLSGQNTGYHTFSFNTGDTGSNTTDFNFLRVLTMTPDVLGTVQAGTGAVRPYISGPGAGKAVFDSNTRLSWILDANLAASQNFGFTGTVTLDNNPKDPNVNHTGFPMTVPMIDKDGGVHFSALCAPATATDNCPTPATGWIVSMNQQVYAGSSHWQMPAIEDLGNLYTDLGLKIGDTRLQWTFFTGPFLGLQPGFYWSCERDAATSPQAPCDLSIHPGFSPNAAMIPMQYSFNFDDGFLGTDEFTKQFYVMVYFPAP